MPFAWSLESMGLALPLFHVEYGIQQETEREYICCLYVAIRDFEGSVWSVMQCFGLIELHPTGTMPEVCRPTMCDGWCRKKNVFSSWSWHQETKEFLNQSPVIFDGQNYEIESNPAWLDWDCERLLLLLNSAIAQCRAIRHCTTPDRQRSSVATA